MFTKSVLSIGAAKAAAAAVMTEADKRKLKVAVAIVDDGGHLLYFERSDGCRLAPVASSQAKAQTAAFYRRSTGIYEEALGKGMTMLLATPNMVPVEGGLPLYHGDGCVGAVGVGGASAKEDGELAAIAVKVIAEF